MKKNFIATFLAAIIVAVILIFVPSMVAYTSKTEAPDVLEPVVTEISVAETSTIITKETTVTTTTTTIATTKITTTTTEEEISEPDEVTYEEEEEEVYYEDDFCTNEDEPVTSYDASYSGSGERDISDYEYNLLVNLTSSEYGSNWVSTDEKSKIAATVLNIADNYYGGDITEAIYNSCVPYGFDPTYDYYKDDSIYSAVDNVLENESAWDNWGATQWSGDGTWNYFT